MSYSPTIKDRVRIALAFVLLDSKEQNEDPSTSILRFQHRLRTYQDGTRSNFYNVLKDFPLQDTRIAYETKLTQMQDQISDLTTRLADREADLSTVFADLEATTSKPPPKKRQKKAIPTPLTNITNQPSTQASPREEAEKTVRETGETADTEMTASVKKKVMAKPGVGGKGLNKDEHPVLVMCRKLDESLDATIKSSMATDTASLLVKLFQTPKDIGQTFLPLRLEAILLHAKDLIRTLSTYLTATFEAASNPRIASTKKSLSSKIKFPKQVINVLIGLSHVILTSTTTCVRSILTVLEGFSEFDLSRVRTEWTGMIILIGTSIIKPSIKAIDETTRKIEAERKKERVTGFGVVNNAVYHTQNVDIRQALVKLLISLSRIDLDISMTRGTSSGRSSTYPLSETVAFGAITALVKLFEAGSNTDKPPSLGLASSNPENHTVEALIAIIRSCIPYLPCLDSDPPCQATQGFDYTHVASMLDAFTTGSGGSTRTGTRGSSNFLLGMSIRTQLVQLLSPIVQPISNSLLGFFSTSDEHATRSTSTLVYDITIKESLLRLMEELIWAEGEEQRGMGDWLLDMIGHGDHPDQIDDMDGVEHLMQSLGNFEAEENIEVEPETMTIELHAPAMQHSGNIITTDQDMTYDGPITSQLTEDRNPPLANHSGTYDASSVPITTEVSAVPVGELVDISATSVKDIITASESLPGPRPSDSEGTSAVERAISSQ